MTAQTRSPEFATQAANVRSMGDTDIRKAAETSNRLLQTPVRALKEGGLAKARRWATRCSSCAGRSRISTPARPPAPASSSGVMPFGEKVVDYFRRYESPRAT